MGQNPAGLVLDPGSPRMFVVMATPARWWSLTAQKRKVIAMWPITGGRSLMRRHGCAHHRLFIGSRVKRSLSINPVNWW